MKGPSVYLAVARSSFTFISLRMKADITKCHHCIHMSPPANGELFVLSSFYVGVGSGWM